MQQSHAHRAGLDATPRRVARHAFWLMLFLLHAFALPFLWSAFRESADLGARMIVLVRLLGMSASAAFFLLKIMDVPSLRMAPGWRSIVAGLVIVAVVHVGVVDRAIGGEFQFNPAHLGVVFFVGTLLHSERFRRILLSALAVLASVRQALTHSLAVCREYAWEARFRPLQPCCVLSYSGPRAPPRHPHTSNC